MSCHFAWKFGQFLSASSQIGKRVHIGYPDPAKATGTDDQKMAVFRTVRDDI